MNSVGAYENDARDLGLEGGSVFFFLHLQQASQHLAYIKKIGRISYNDRMNELNERTCNSVIHLIEWITLNTHEHPPDLPIIQKSPYPKSRVFAIFPRSCFIFCSV